MAIPVIKCAKCGYIFSIEIKQDRERQWLIIDPEHECIQEKKEEECESQSTLE